jgi:hypothetical protein
VRVCTKCGLDLDESRFSWKIKDRHNPATHEEAMKLTPELKAKIDAKTYQELLSRWRFAPIGDTMFQDESGEYWGKRMAELRAQGADHVGASKSIGW